MITISHPHGKRTLGREIVDAFQSYSKRAGALQEQLGRAILHVTQAQTGSEEFRAANQEQLGSLVVAAVRTEALADRLTLLAAIESLPEDTAVVSTEPASWPGVADGLLDCRQSHVGDRLFWRALADRSEQRNQSPRRVTASRSQVGISHSGVGVNVGGKDSRVRTRASDICQESIGESWRALSPWWRSSSSAWICCIPAGRDRSVSPVAAGKDRVTRQERRRLAVDMLRRTRAGDATDDGIRRKERWHMVEIIGLVTMGALIGLLAWSMAGESESEKRRISGVGGRGPSSKAVVSGRRTKQAA